MSWVLALHSVSLRHREHVNSLAFLTVPPVLTVLSTVLFRAEKTSVWTSNYYSSESHKDYQLPKSINWTQSTSRQGRRSCCPLHWVWNSQISGSRALVLSSLSRDNQPQWRIEGLQPRSPLPLQRLQDSSRLCIPAGSKVEPQRSLHWCVYSTGDWKSEGDQCRQGCRTFTGASTGTNECLDDG